jgi:hypothetical protein
MAPADDLQAHVLVLLSILDPKARELKQIRAHVDGCMLRVLYSPGELFSKAADFQSFTKLLGEAFNRFDVEL